MIQPTKTKSLSAKNIPEISNMTPIFEHGFFISDYSATVEQSSFGILAHRTLRFQQPAKS